MSDTQLARSTPEAQGIDSAAVLGFVNAVEQHGLGLHSLMLLRHGQVVAEGWWQPYAPDLPHMLFSVSKSFTSTAVGFAVGEGLLSVDDPVISFFPDETPADASPNLQAMRVRHLLSMSTGHEEDTIPWFNRTPDRNWVETFLAGPVGREPGSLFIYNSGATYMLSAIVQKVTGQRLLDYLAPRLFAPLGITGATWEQSPQSIDVGGWGLKIKTEDIARLAQLYLQHGMWNGARVLPAGWAEQATSFQVDNSNWENIDWQQGYGYQFWRSRHNTYRGDGAFGQFCLVLPDQDAVLATTAGLQDMQAVLNLVWEHLLPGMHADPLPESGVHDALRTKLANLQLPAQNGAATSPIAARVSGTTYHLDANDIGINALAFAFGEAGNQITVQTPSGTQQIDCAPGTWINAPGMWETIGIPLSTAYPHPFAASAAWTADDTYTVQLCMRDAPFVATLACRFQDQQISIEPQVNVSFGPTAASPIIGRAA